MKSPPELLKEVQSFDFLNSVMSDINVSEYELSFNIEHTNIVKTIRFLRDEPLLSFTQLIDLCGIDWPEKKERFQVAYNLLSMNNNSRIRVKSFTDNNNSLPSITKLFPSSDWYEREAFDLFGINFEGHKDLRRLLTDYGFEGYPLRKDFPLTGYVEVKYDEEKKRVIYKPVELEQEYRNFDFESPWEGVEYPDETIKDD
ncbi:MAG: NADH-quinone oxidoreductase subunit C [Pseudomonadota bacterium]|nr:NADH-quinone oxidoreductase subunit C [Pseudomonadota bacterium]